MRDSTAAFWENGFPRVGVWCRPAPAGRAAGLASRRSRLQAPGSRLQEIADLVPSEPAAHFEP